MMAPATDALNERIRMGVFGTVSCASVKLFGSDGIGQ